MKGAVLCFLALAAVALARPDGDKYTDKYDNINLDEILDNNKLVEAYSRCFLGTGKCTAEGTELKSHIKEALETECAKCTETQRKGTEKVIGHYIRKDPEVWEMLKSKYDPTGKFSKKYEARLKAVQA